MRKTNWVTLGPKIEQLLKADKTLTTKKACEKFRVNLDGFYSWRAAEKKKLAKLPTKRKEAKVTQIAIPAPQKAGMLFLAFGPPTQIRELLSAYENN